MIEMRTRVPVKNDFFMDTFFLLAVLLVSIVSLQINLDLTTECLRLKHLPVRGHKTDSDLLSNHEPSLMRCFPGTGCCNFRWRDFLGGRFTLCVVRPAKRVLYRPTGFALVLSTRPLRSAYNRYR